MKLKLTGILLVADTTLAEVEAAVFKVCSGFVDLGLVVEGTQLDTN